MTKKEKSYTEMYYAIYNCLYTYDENDKFTSKDVYEKVKKSYNRKDLTEKSVYKYLNNKAYSGLFSLVISSDTNMDKTKWNEKEFRINVHCDEYKKYKEWLKKSQKEKTVEELKAEIERLTLENEKLKKQVKGLCITNNRNKKLLSNRTTK